MTGQTISAGYLIIGVSLLVLGAALAWPQVGIKVRGLVTYVRELALIHQMSQENRRLMARVDSLRLSINEEERKWNVWVEQALRQLPPDNVIPLQRKAGGQS